MDKKNNSGRVQLHAFLIVPALWAAMSFIAPANAAPEFRVSAGGNHDWVPTSGAQVVTSGSAVTIDGIMADANGKAAYLAQSGPGVVTARQVGSVRTVGGFTPRFGPILAARSTQQLIVSGPGTEALVSLNVHVDGGFTISCPGNNCYVNLAVTVALFQQFYTTTVTLQDGVLVPNSLGLTVDAVPGGYHVYGDVQTPAVPQPTNVPLTLTLSVDASVGILGSGIAESISWDAWFDEASITPSGRAIAPGPALNVPPGYAVSGDNLVDNAWTGPFTPPASVSGAVVYDIDGDGVHDPSERVLGGITVFLDANGNGALDAGERTVDTEPNGRYIFLNLEPGTYTIDYDFADLPADFYNTGTKPISVTVATGEDSVGQDFFAEHPVPALVADYRFADSRASSVGTPPDLVDIGVGNAFADTVVDGENHRVLTFPEGNGLSLNPTTGVIPNDRYTIVMDARLDTLGAGFGAQLLDFTGGTESFKGLSIFSPFGVYFEASGGCFGDNYLYPDLTTGEWFEVAISRDHAGFVRVFVDGDEKLICNDSGGFGIVTPANVLRFFRGHDSDFHGAGAVGRIRLYENAMTAEEIAALDEPGPADVIVTDCDDPALAQLTVVTGDLIIENLPDCDAIDMSSLTSVSGNLVISGTSASAIDMSSLTTVSGNLVIEGNAAAEAIDMSSLTTVSGDLVIEENTSADPIDMSSLTTVGGNLDIINNVAVGSLDLTSLQSAGSLDITGNTSANPIDMSTLTTVAGDLNVVNNGTAAIRMGDLGQVAGELTIETTSSGEVFDMSDGAVTGSIDLTTLGYTQVSGQTADGTTDVQNADGQAVMHVALPEGSFDSPVAFTIARLDPATLDPEPGTDSDGNPAMIDPLSAYEFSFAVPTLNLDATLTFEINVAALDAPTRDILLAALAAGSATLVTRDQPADSFQAFAVCAAGQSPGVDGCVLIEQFDAVGQPTTSDPAIVRFTGVTGHFSTWGVAVVSSTTDSTPPSIDIHDAVTAEATGPTGAVVTYTKPDATDDVDGAVEVTCAPASGSTFPLGTMTVGCLAVDTAGNSAETQFHVNVLDTIAPTITVPGNITLDATGPTGASVNFTATAEDLVDGATPAVCSPASGSVFPIGLTVVTCGKTDAHSNAAVPTMFNVTVVDATGDVTNPVVQLLRPLPGQVWKNNKLVTTSGSGPAVVLGYVNVMISATDDVGIASVSFAVNGVAVPAGGVAQSGSTYSFRYRPKAKQQNTISYTATDAAGNSITQQTTVLGRR